MLADVRDDVFVETLLSAYSECMSGDEMTQARGWVVLAHILRPQGRKGEVLAELLTDFPERFAEGARVFAAAPGFAGEAAEAREMRVAGHWLPVGRNHGRVVLHFAGVETIEAAEALEGLDILVPEEERKELEEDAAYVSDLVGCTVFDGERAVGEVTGVEFPTTADGARRLPDAAPLLTVLAGADEVLIPYVQAFLVRLDTAAKRIEMRLPDGLVELNRRSDPPSP